LKATIYIPEDQSHIYENAKEKLGESISKTFLKCLERELESVRQKTGRIVVEIRDPKTDRVTKKAFEGRFLIGSEDQGEEFHFGEEDGSIRDAGYSAYAVAITKPPANRLAVLFFDRDGCIDFNVYDDFDEFKSAEIDNKYPLYPKSLVSAVASELDIDVIEELDI
jgi:hypothetical protein